MSWQGIPHGRRGKFKGGYRPKSGERGHGFPRVYRTKRWSFWSDYYRALNIVKTGWTRTAAGPIQSTSMNGSLIPLPR